MQRVSGVLLKVNLSSKQEDDPIEGWVYYDARSDELFDVDPNAWWLWEEKLNFSWIFYIGEL